MDARAKASVIEPARALKPIRIDELLTMEIKPRTYLLAPVLPEKGLMMIHAKRGVGKTFLGLSIGYAIASGGAVARWKASAPRKVLLLDGEMPLHSLQERMRAIVAGSETEATPENFEILAADAFEDGLPNLSYEDGQLAVDPFLEGVSCVIFDNLSTLTSAARDNDAESWSPIQEWLLRLRRRGISVIILHHSGKGGLQRGTSRREDVLDTIIGLRHPDDYNLADGARFQVHFEKARGFLGADAEPFEIKLENRNGGCSWTSRNIEDAEQAQVAALLDEGLAVRDIAEAIGMSKSKVGRLKKKIEANGSGLRSGQ